MPNSGAHLNDSLIAGAAGAMALTAVHQAARAVTESARRMDVVGMRALARSFKAAGTKAPKTHAGLYRATLAGDLIFNSACYSPATNDTRGVALGLLAGFGALVLPKKMGLGTPPGSDLLSNQLMTVGSYVIGGLAAACTANWLAARRGEAAREFVGGY